MKLMVWSVVVLLAGAGAANAGNPVAVSAARYEACLSLAAKRPPEAVDAAKKWIATGGGAPARHCRAVALLGLGRAAEAAHLLEDIADDRSEPTPERLRADLLGQAGNAWLAADRPEAARRVLTRALARRPGNPGLLIDRGIAYASLKEFWLALDDLSRALKRDPERMDALLFRAKVYRWLGEPNLAYADARSALAIRPGNPEALLETGAALRLKGDREGARRVWRTLVETAPRDPMAELARRELMKLDKTERKSN
jgi:tetratricopeptide (TPR) repeat protein